MKNKLHSHGLTELVLDDLKEDEYRIGVSRDIAPIYTLGSKFNGYEHAKTQVHIFKSPYKYDLEFNQALMCTKEFDVVTIGDYAFTGNIIIIKHNKDEEFVIYADKMVIAKYIYD